MALRAASVGVAKKLSCGEADPAHPDQIASDQAREDPGHPGIRVCS